MLCRVVEKIAAKEGVVKWVVTCGSARGFSS